jgi:N-acyl-L-homoserine lactone synthetase
MVDVITANNRHRYTALLEQMHRDRKKVFVDRFKWDIPVVDGQFEIDQFDNADAIYLMALDPRRQRHLGSVRLLPSTGSHLLADIFPHLCEKGVPAAPDVWEITRLLTTPAKDVDPRPTHMQIIMALCEFGLLYGIRQYTCVVHMHLLSALLALGWECEPLGEPQLIAGDMCGALAINITPATLQLFRDRVQSRVPVLQLSDIAEAA